MSKIIEVKPELRDQIQSLHYELDSTKDLLAYLWDKPTRNQDAIDYYNKQYAEIFAEFELAKDNLTELYGIKNTNCHWEFDYNRCVLIVEEVEE